MSRKTAGRPTRVLIRGRGRVGRALASSLRRARVDVRFVGRAGAAPPADALILAVPDRVIASEARRLARARGTYPLVLHSSGTLTSAALAPFARRGSPTASFHPLRAFSGLPGETLEGCAVAIEGDPAGERRARALARRLGAVPWRIRPASKAAYHAAAVLAAGGTAALSAAAARLAAARGMPRRLASRAFAELSMGAVGNLLSRGVPAGLTGPAVRGDERVVRAHRRALSGDRRLERLYAELTALMRSLLRVDRPARTPLK